MTVLEIKLNQEIDATVIHLFVTKLKSTKYFINLLIYPKIISYTLVKIRKKKQKWIIRNLI